MDVCKYIFEVVQLGWILMIIVGCVSVQHQIHIIGKATVVVQAFSLQPNASAHPLSDDDTVTALLTLVAAPPASRYRRSPKRRTPSDVPQSH